MLSLIINDSKSKTFYDKVIEISNLKKKIEGALKSGQLGNNGKKNSALNISGDIPTIEFFSFLVNKNGLESLVRIKPQRIPTFTNRISIKYPDLNNKKSILYKAVYKLFVEWIYKTPKIKYLLVSLVDIHTCPYCNRNYIYRCKKTNNNTVVKPEIDHYLTKDTYPYLAISFYNLIPSCQYCNGVTGKHTANSLQTGLINPYLINSNDFQFTWIPSNIRSMASLKRKKKVEIKLNIKRNLKVEPNIETFHLRELYKLHGDHVAELILKSNIYPQSYRDELKKNFNISEDDINRLIVGNYTKEEELHRRPLSKLYLDIAKELKLI